MKGWSGTRLKCLHSVWLHSRRDAGCGCAECVAFTHLYLGSALENARDRVADMKT